MSPEINKVLLVDDDDIVREVAAICLRTSDIRGDGESLADGGYRVLRPEPTRGAGGCWVQFVHPKSAGGVLLELSEPED